MIYPKSQIIEVKDEASFALLRAAVDRDTRLSFDTETSGLAWTDMPFMMTWFAAGQGFVLDKRRVPREWWQKIGAWTLTITDRPLVGSYILFDLLMGRKEFGVRFVGTVHDTKLQAFLLDEWQNCGLKELAEARWPSSQDLQKEVFQWFEDHNDGKVDFTKLPYDLCSHYAVQDTYLSHKLDEVNRPAVETLCKELYDTERELVLVLADMQFDGVRLDIPYLQRLGESLRTELKILEPQLFGLAGCTFDPNSSVEIADLMYDKLKEPIKFRNAPTKTAIKKLGPGAIGTPSTDKEALQAMQHPLAKVLLDHRDRSTSLNTFIDPWLGFADKNGYIHPRLNQTGTKSGRFSSDSPNAQQIPKRSKSAKRLRAAFLYPEGKVGLSEDQRQMEMVGFAHYSADPTMRSVLMAGGDLHHATAIECGLATEDTCTSDHRRLGKGANFSVVYCCGDKKLGAFLSGDMYAGRYVPTEEALGIRAKYFRRFPGVRDFQRRVMHTIDTRPNRAITNMFGRRMTLPVGKSYVGVNRLVQSWAADQMKRGMVKSWRYSLKTDDLRLNVNIHDDLKTHCLEKNFEEHARNLDAFLTDCPGLSVPIRTEISFSRTNWADEVEVKNFKVPAC